MSKPEVVINSRIWHKVWFEGVKPKRKYKKRLSKVVVEKSTNHTWLIERFVLSKEGKNIKGLYVISKNTNPDERRWVSYYKLKKYYV